MAATVEQMISRIKGEFLTPLLSIAGREANSNSVAIAQRGCPAITVGTAAAAGVVAGVAGAYNQSVANAGSNATWVLTVQAAELVLNTAMVAADAFASQTQQTNAANAAAANLVAVANASARDPEVILAALRNGVDTALAAGAAAAAGVAGGPVTAVSRAAVLATLRDEAREVASLMLPAGAMNADAPGTTAAAAAAVAVPLVAAGAGPAIAAADVTAWNNAGGAIGLGLPNTMKTQWKSDQFNQLATVDLSSVMTPASTAANARVTTAQDAVIENVCEVIGQAIHVEVARAYTDRAAGGAGAPERLFTSDAVLNASINSVVAARAAGAPIPNATNLAITGRVTFHGDAAAAAAGVAPGNTLVDIFANLDVAVIPPAVNAAIVAAINAVLAAGAVAVAPVAGIVAAPAAVTAASTGLNAALVAANAAVIPAVIGAIRAKYTTALAAPGLTIIPTPNAPYPNWDDYEASEYVALNGMPLAQLKDRTRYAVLNADLRIKTQSLQNLMIKIFNDDGYFLNTKTNRLIYKLPKSDELLRRLVAPIFAKRAGVDTNNTTAAMVDRMSGELFNSMPKSDGDAYIAAVLDLSKEDEQSLEKYDKHIDELREALSQGPAGQPAPIKSANIVVQPSLTKVSVISRSPYREVILNRRRSDPSNPASAMNRINIALNTGSGMMRGGAIKNKAGPLYPKIVMNGGSHPFAVLEGGAAAPPSTREAPNTVALLDARIRELQAQYESATGKKLNTQINTDIVQFSTRIYDNIKDVQKGLNTLADANKALAQYPVGLGIDAGTFSEAQLKNITTQADEINKKALKASKQLTKLEQIADTLQELVNKSTPAKRV